MNTCLAIVSVLLLAQLLCACATQQDRRIFQGEAAISKLSPEVQQSRLAVSCPPAPIESVAFRVKTFPDEQVLGRQAYRLVARDDGISTLTMTSSGHRIQDWIGIPAELASHGRILSCGGLFTFALSEKLTSNASPLVADMPAAKQTSARMGATQRDRRFEVKQIDAVTGALFPLKVGNELSFSYAARLQSLSQTSRPLRKQVRYRVLGVNESFSLNGDRLPGKVFLVERYEKHAESNVQSTRDYYFSQALGWVVRAVQYYDGTPVTVMDMTGRNGQQ